MAGEGAAVPNPPDICPHPLTVNKWLSRARQQASGFNSGASFPQCIEVPARHARSEKN
jgi:hypothetical protein